MLLSMTGFGKATVVIPGRTITAEVKSLNSKQFDLSTRIPSSLRAHEIDMRNILASKLQRGKADFAITVENTAAAVSCHLNVDNLAAYRAQVSEAAVALGIPEPEDWYSVLLRFPDVMQANEEESVDDEAVACAMREVTTLAADALLDYRRAEGRKLEEFFAVRIQHISELLAQTPQYEAERIQRIRTRMAEALQSIPVIEYDKGRLEQEMIFYIEKLDVNEERQRLTQHLAYFLETMEQDPGQGKKLGFIAQEMGREINTLGSKSNHAEMQRIVVMMKDLLEQIKEQVLNVM